MENEPLDLWFAFPDDFVEKDRFAHALKILSEDERNKLRCLRFDSSQREYLAAHVLLRTALSYREPAPPDAWRFRPNDYGKPLLDPPGRLSFNLSRRSGLVACLVAHRGEVGVDIESHQRSHKIVEIAPRVFSPSELAQMDVLESGEKPDHALSLWTLKEAYTKARGMGFSLPLLEFSFLRCEGGNMRLEANPSVNADAERWQFCLLDHAGYRVALMIERQPRPCLQVWELYPQESSFRSLALAAKWAPSAPKST